MRLVDVRYLTMLIVVGVMIGYFNVLDPTQAQVPNGVEGVDNPPELASGTIASMGRIMESRELAVTSGDSAPGDWKSPIVASISKLSAGGCQVTVRNESTAATYAISFEVVGSDKLGKVTFVRTFSERLAAGKNVERKVPCGRDENIEVWLKSGKRV